MRNLWAVARTELRLTWRRRSFWVSQILALLPVLLYFASDTMSSGLEVNTVMIGQLLMVELFMLPLIVGPAISRDLGEAGDLLWTTPLDAGSHLGGMALGLGLALLPVLVAQVAVRWLVAVTQGVGGPILLWTYGLPMLVLGLSVGLVSTLGLGLLLRRTVLVVIGGIAFWIFFFMILGPSRTPGLSLLQFYGVLFQWMQPSAALGIHLYTPLIRSFAVVLVALALGLGVLTLGVALFTDRRRAVRSAVPALVLVLVAGLVGGGGALLFSEAAAAQATPISPVDVQPGAWVVQAHTLEATVDWAQGRIVGQSTLQLAPAQPITSTRLVLRLNPGMTLTEAHLLVTGEPQQLVARPVGDSVEITLPAPPTATLTLDLHWAGMPHIPYLDYNVNGFGPAAWTVRQPVRALVTADAGYLLRDGDWYPWPWTTPPRQAAHLHMTLHSSAARTLATAPLRDGTATWDGVLPPALLVLPPPQEEHIAGVTLAAGRLTTALTWTALRADATTLGQVWDRLDPAPPPTHIVALPYLPESLWVGDLLLLTEDRAPAAPGAEAQNALFDLTRSWLGAYLPDAPQTLTRVGLPGGPPAHSDGSVAQPAPGTVSTNQPGRWIETLDPAKAPATTSLEFPVTAWLVLELENPTTRAADLAHYQHPTYEAQYAPTVLALHEWGARIGSEHAVRLLGEAVRSGVALDAAHLFPELERRSGVPLQPYGSELQQQMGQP